MTPETTPIEFIVVGGGIGGLCAAIGLTRGRHRVTLFDEGHDFDKTKLAGGCRVPANVANVFYKWGLEEQLRAAGAPMEGVRFLHYETGHVTTGFEPGPELFNQTGAEILSIHYADLRRILFAETVRCGTKVQADAEVTAYHPHKERPSITLASGETIHGDVIVAADGLEGLSRKLFLGEKSQGKSLHKMMYNAIIDHANLSQELLDFVKPLQISCWFDKERGAVGFPIGRDVYSLHVFSQEEAIGVTVAELDKDEFVKALAGGEHRLVDLAKMATVVAGIPVIERQRLTEWVHPEGRLLAIGEAAHPILPGSFFALAMAAGDGIVIGRLFEHLHRNDQISRYLAGVQEVRETRLEDVMDAARRNPWALSFPEARVNPSNDQDKFAYLQEVFTTIWGHDPQDEADDWWTQWGMLQERAAGTISYSIQVNAEKEQGSPHSDL